MAAKKKDLLKCKTKEDVASFAMKNGLLMASHGDIVVVGGWTCVFIGNKFQYVK